MANRITDEQKIQINELYAENHNKSLTARILKISPASVSKYIIPDYIPKAQRTLITSVAQPTGCNDFIATTKKGLQSKDINKVFREITRISSVEKENLKKLMNEIYS